MSALLTTLKTAWFAALVVQLHPVASAQIVAPGATLKLISDDFKFTEGPTSDERGNVFFTDQPNNRILYYDFKTDKVTTWLQPSGRSNGLFYIDNEQMIACADERNELWRINIQTKEFEILAKSFEDQSFGGPNDCWVDNDGSVYFTDPLYQRPYWTQTISNDHPRAVYRLSPSGSLSQVATDLTQPNGIIGDQQQRILYVADINANRTYRYRIDKDGQLAKKTLFCEFGSDGMTIDTDGNVYLTGGRGVMVFDQEGNQITTIAVPRRWTANVTFAGPARQSLFITAGDAVFKIKTLVQGQLTRR